MKKALFLTGLLASMVIVLTGCGRTEINANDYLTLEATGYDTIGTAGYTIDIEQLVDDNLSAFELEDSMNYEYLGVVSKIQDCMKGDIDKYEKLSNGDKIKYTWNESGLKKLEDKYKVKFKFKDEKLKVDSLKKLKEFDPFEYVNITYTGISPNGNIQISSKEGIPVNIMFDADKSSNLSNGDVIKVTAISNSSNNTELKEYCLMNGFIPTCNEKEYTVEGLSSYVQAIKEVPSDAMKKMDSHAQDTFKAHVADSWEDSESLVGIELIGNYLLTPKDPSISVDKQNYLYFIYKVTAGDPTTEDNKTDTFDYYYYSYFTDIMLLEDGTCSFDLNSMKKAEGSMFFGNVSGEAIAKDNYYYEGYGDLDSLFNKHVTTKISEYQYESTVKE